MKLALVRDGKDRPNRLGLTTCEVRAVGPGWIDVAGLDAVDGTPVLDVKPYLRGFAPRGDVREPAWATELMAGYWSVGQSKDWVIKQGGWDATCN